MIAAWRDFGSMVRSIADSFPYGSRMGVLVSAVVLKSVSFSAVQTKVVV